MDDIKVNTIWKSDWDTFIIIVDMFKQDSGTIVKYRPLSEQNSWYLTQERFVSDFLTYFTPFH